MNFLPFFFLFFFCVRILANFLTFCFDITGYLTSLIKLQDLGNLFHWHWICGVVGRLTSDPVVVYFEYIQQKHRTMSFNASSRLQEAEGRGCRSFEGTFSLTRIFCVHSCGGVDSRLNGPPRDLKRNFPSSSLLFSPPLSQLFLFFPSLSLFLSLFIAPLSNC